MARRVFASRRISTATPSSLLRKLTADGNGRSTEGGEGIWVEELLEGDLRFTMLRSSASDNTDDGVHLLEEDVGDVRAIIGLSTVSDNGNDGLDLNEYDAGSGSLTQFFSTITGNGAANVFTNF